MSADNGIYILKTPAAPNPNAGFEYRVANAGAIENIWYDNDDGNAEAMVSYFGNTKVFKVESDALIEAAKLHHEVGYTEYGIQFIDGPVPFHTYLIQNYDAQLAINSHMVKKVAGLMDEVGIKSKNVTSIVVNYGVSEYVGDGVTHNSHYRMTVTHGSTTHEPL